MLKKAIGQFYIKDKQSTASIKSGGRQELCDLLMSSVTKAFHNYGITNIKPLPSDDEDKLTKPMKLEKNAFGDNNAGLLFSFFSFLCQNQTGFACFW